jgi:alkanesulfonate monooxygenase SsuD/methylene tetrahydromethanopterin reductase-like flavin-dependent oxidoreductase (luciferase family)
MKLGLDIGYSGAKWQLPVEMVQEAERLGFDSVWTAEAYGTDAFTPLIYLGALTKKIRLATGICQIAARTPANCAMVAQTLDHLAGEGRVVVGLGVSGPQIVEGWYGQPWGKPANRLRDYVAIMKKIWRREAPVVHDGKEISLPYTGPGSTGLGKPLKSILHGNPNIPIVLGTGKETSVRLTGEIADGWSVMRLTPVTMPPALKWLGEGLAKRKDGGMGAQDVNFHKDAMIDHGFGAEAERVQELFLAGRKEEAAAAIPDEYLDAQGVFGPPARIKERYAAWRDCGFTLLRVGGMSHEHMKLIADIVRA